MQDIMYVNIKVSKEAKILELTQEKFQEIRERYDKQGFSTKVLAYQNRILKKEQKYPLDYIMVVPETVGSQSLAQALRENRLKNVAMRIAIDIRERRRKPKLRDFIQKYKEKLRDTDDKRAAKEEFQRKFRMLYGGGNDENAEDVKFNKLMSNFDRF